ncbi:hypothetical protein PLICRDRAFT_175118 [Plicaturopsis crispa FD-325 SS-3]|nr:hypothetical protein PLICRDRAFT_175118 [Plicaturopsis crispa FD-325 SS-3]
MTDSSPTHDILSTQSSPSSYHDNNQENHRRQNRRQGIQQDAGWAPDLSAIPDDQPSDYPDHHTQSLNPSANPMMRHQNRSAPSLPSERPPAYETDEPVPPLPSFDPTSALDKFSAMRLSDPVPRGSSAMSFNDPIPRAGTSMSMQSAQSPQHHNAHHPRHANTLPSAPNQGRPSRGDTASVYSSHSGNSRQNSGYGDPREAYDGAMDSDNASYYSYEDQGGQMAPNGHRYPPRVSSQQSWNGPSGHDVYYSAASDVLGMAPPPAPPSITYPDDGSGYSASHASLAGSQYSLSSSQSAPYVQQTYQQPGPYQQAAPGPYQQPGPALSPYNGGQPRPSNASMVSMPSSVTFPEDRDFDPRPPLNRMGTTASVTPRTDKTKAVDLTAPPFTKEYIDQYRHRIKADPDPEAHFLYAKYLIDAAKKIGADAKDQRAVKKYRDLLITEALKVIRRLATQGQAYDEAQFFLANCYGTGMLGLQVDHERAYHLYLQAAKQNHAAASYRVAVCNEIGAGTRREPPRAAAFYRKAASLGDTPAMYKLGMILLNGSLGEARNPREAINWLRRAAEQADEENPHALHELALLHEMPNSQLVVYDPAYARNLYTQAAHLGYTASQYKLGQCFEYGSLTCPVDPRRSIAWYTKAAEKGNPEAELALSGWYLTGSEGVLKQSDSEAYLWARRAANKGSSKAEYAVGYYAEVGIGIKQDVEFAKRWYMRAAAQGNKRAMNRLTEMKRVGNKKGPSIARPTRQQAKDECVIS